MGAGATIGATGYELSSQTLGDPWLSAATGLTLAAAAGGLKEWLDTGTAGEASAGDLMATVVGAALTVGILVIWDHISPYKESEKGMITVLPSSLNRETPTSDAVDPASLRIPSGHESQFPKEFRDTLFKLDPRSILAFRLLLTTALFTDLAERFFSTSYFFTESGVFPKPLWDKIYGYKPYYWSLHFSDSDALIWTMVGLQVVLAGCLVIGYRLKITLFLSWILLLSMNLSNPLLTYGGDKLSPGSSSHSHLNPAHLGSTAKSGRWPAHLPCGSAHAYAGYHALHSRRGSEGLASSLDDRRRSFTTP